MGTTFKPSSAKSGNSGRQNKDNLSNWMGFVFCDHYSASPVSWWIVIADPACSRYELMGIGTKTANIQSALCLLLHGKEMKKDPDVFHYPHSFLSTAQKPGWQLGPVPSPVLQPDDPIETRRQNNLNQVYRCAERRQVAEGTKNSQEMSPIWRHGS
ncbi:hypothetical protein LY78DRAFT_663862 [Colletotrichum sublineola]|nr:hypothetical protein LY78DRAFT_663862 [Colletotrichum sublineola]